jgi:hypothetical protein
MLRIFKTVFLSLAFFLVILLVTTVNLVDRTPYKKMDFYKSMATRLDSLKLNYSQSSPTDSIIVGWAEKNITPDSPAPLAGYGARDSKTYEGILDSIFIKTIYLETIETKVAIVTADLLIIHPEVDQYVTSHLPDNWSRDQIYFTASHSHSSIGGWAPKFVGELFAGTYDKDMVEFLGKAVLKTLEEAEIMSNTGSVVYSEIMADDLMKNRLVKDKGIIDPWLKVLRLQRDSTLGLLNIFSAHATCYDHQNKKLSGDYPGILNQSLMGDSTYSMAAFAAGAVGSMGPNPTNKEEPATEIATKLKEQLDLLRFLGAGNPLNSNLKVFRMDLPLRAPQVKIAKHFAFRPYLFNAAFGEYSAQISVLQLGNLVMIGLPLELSGELAVPLYQYARSVGLNLVITSFNGGYFGYVVKDEWYDLEKYESRTMSWLGHDSGAYISEVIIKLLDVLK